MRPGAVAGARPGDVVGSVAVVEAVDESQAVGCQQTHAVPCVVEDDAGLITEEEEETMGREDGVSRDVIGKATAVSIIQPPGADVDSLGLWVVELDVFIAVVGAAVAVEVDRSWGGQDFVE